MLLFSLFLTEPLLFLQTAKAEETQDGQNVRPVSRSIEESRQLWEKENADFYVKNWDFDITVNENGSLDVTETVDVFFNRRRHGFSRWLMKDVRMEKEKENGDFEWYNYHAVINNIKAEDLAKQETVEHAQIFYFGDPNRYVEGDETYRYSYTYDLGPDGFNGYDEVYHNLNGADCPVYIDHMTFRIEFPKDFDTDEIRFYSGSYGSTDFNDADTLTYEVDGNVIQGYTLKTLEPNESVTLKVRLPEGYFDKYRAGNIVMILLFTAGVLLILVVGALMRSHYRTHPVVPTVEFYPPEDVTPAEVGYIIDGVTSNQELMSMVVWYAEKGYLTIREDECKRIWLTRTAKRTGQSRKDLNGYKVQLLDGLFGGSAYETVCLNSVDEDFYEVLNKCCALLPTEYRFGEKRLEDKGVRSKAAVLIVLLALLQAGLIWFSGGLFSSTAYIAMTVTSAITVLIQGFTTQKMRRERGFLSASTMGLMYAARVISALVTVGCALAAGFFGVVPFVLPALGAVGIVAALHLAGNCFYPTPYYIQLAGRLVGFRSFIEKAELPRIEKLAEQDPEYFYKVLPYAYVFGLSDVWMDRFEQLAVPPPTPSWYEGSASIYDRYWMRNIYHSYGAAISSATSAYTASREAASASRSGGFGGGGFGGGFSGGGGGGGGCGSW